MTTKRAQDATVRENKIRAALVSWEALNELISKMDEEDVLHAMKVERGQANRQSFLKRLTQRLSGIRIAQVKDEVEAATEEVIGGSKSRTRRDRRRN